MVGWTRIAGVACAAVTLSASMAAAQAVLPERTTYVTFDAPVAIPGAVLPPGEYMFRLVDTQANRTAVHIFDRERSRIFATLIGMNALRDRMEGDTVITFHEVPADRAPALRHWYFAGERNGVEFAYPRQEAMELARHSRESVLTVDSASADPDEMSRGEISRVDAAMAANDRQAEGQRADAASPALEADARDRAGERAGAQAGVAQPDREREMDGRQQPAGATPTTTGTMTTTEAAPARDAAETGASDRAQAGTAAQADRDDETRAVGTTGATAEQRQQASPAGAADTARPVGTSGTAQAEPAPRATQPQPGMGAQRRELPRTATALPLLGLGGFLALGAGLGARALRRRMGQ